MAQKAQTKPPKGTRDFLAPDLRRRAHVTGIIRDVYEAHGFEPLETPTFERLDTLLGKYGEEGDQLVFKILHRGQPLVDGIRQAAAFIAEEGHIVEGRSGETAPGAERLLSDLGLRYDLTVPLARVFAAQQGHLPPVYRRYQIQPVWRADNPGKGRFREFYQCDVDVVGASGPAVEAEVVGAVAECLDRLGFGSSEIRINHRQLLRAFVETAGLDPEQEASAIVAVDKLDKVGREAVLEEMVAKGIEPAMGDRLLGLILSEPTLDAARSAVGDHEGGRKALEELERVLRLAAATPAADKLAFTPTLARGLGYYTGPIFEIVHPDLSGSLGGGGRYDGLIGMFSGKAVPACGFSIGLERILVLMEERGMFPELPAAADVAVSYAAEAREEEALRLAYRLRKEGLRVELHPKTEKPGKLKKQAEPRGWRGIVFLGADPETPPRLWRPETGELEPLPEPLAPAL